MVFGSWMGKPVFHGIILRIEAERVLTLDNRGDTRYWYLIPHIEIVCPD